MGMSPQSGVPQNNRVGDFDPYALPLIMQQTGMTLDEVLDEIGCQGGLLGISGFSGDIRDLQQAAAAGHADARLALDVYVSDIRRYLGGLLVELGGADAIVFTGGIGENGVEIRSAVCRDLAELGIELDEDRNRAAQRRRHRACRLQPRADLGRADERRVGRRAPNPGTVERDNRCSSPRSPDHSSPRRRCPPWWATSCWSWNRIAWKLEGAQEPDRRPAVRSSPSTRWEPARASSC